MSNLFFIPPKDTADLNFTWTSEKKQKETHKKPRTERQIVENQQVNKKDSSDFCVKNLQIWESTYSPSYRYWVCLP